MATSTGVAARYRLIPPPAGTPWSCSTTRPGHRGRDRGHLRDQAAQPGAAGPGPLLSPRVSAGRTGRPGPRPAMLPGRDQRRAGQRGRDRDRGQRQAQRRRGVRRAGHRHGQPRAGQRGQHGHDRGAAQHHRRDLPHRRAPGAQQAQVVGPADGDHPGREQDHRRADHDQADEQQQQHGLHRGLGVQERGQHRNQRGRDRRRARRGREAPGQPERDRARPVEVVEQGLRPVRARRRRRPAGTPTGCRCSRTRAHSAWRRTGLGPRRPHPTQQLQVSSPWMRLGTADRAVLRPEGEVGPAYPHDRGDDDPTGPVGMVSTTREPGCSPNRAAICVVTAPASAPRGSAPCA